MAETSSSDTTSDYCNECYSDISSEKSWLEYVVVGQKPCMLPRRSRTNFLQKLYNREIRGCLSAHSYALEEKLFLAVPSWRHIPLSHVLPKSALQAGHIVMGLTQCGQFLLTYTYSLDVSGNISLYKYLLHWWAFTSNRVARKVAEVTLFGSYTIYRELNIVISQWPTERNKLVIHGLCTDLRHLQPTDRAYLTITTVPSLHSCKDCLKVAASYEEEDMAATWDGCLRCNCLQHGLTVHTTYEVISPYPRFRAAVCLKYWNHVVVNTGNFLHVLRVDLDSAKSKIHRASEKQDAVIVDSLPVDVSELEEVEESKIDGSECSEERPGSLDSTAIEPIPKSYSGMENGFTDETSKFEKQFPQEIPLNTSSSNQSDICDINKPSSNLSVRLCECVDSVECKCETKVSPNHRTELAISIKDKILQDFCGDMSQELNIGSDLITLVKHASCSPRSSPQRLPLDLQPMTWSPPILTPPSDILKTRNSESSQKFARCQRANSPQPGASQNGANAISITSINSPLHTLTISPSSSCSSRLMSPPMTRSFRHLSPRKRSSVLQSPPPNLPPTPPRSRTTHKLTLEAEKAYEFTDEAQETCEKLSSYRKRRLADKKYEFRDEAEDAENIVPFKHLRDQSKHRSCSLHQMASPVTSPVLPNGRRRRIDSEQSDASEFMSTPDSVVSVDSQNMEAAEKCVLRPLNQNQIPNGIHRDRSCKSCPNSSPLVPKGSLQYPTIKCTAHFKRSYIELDDEMVSVITDVEDDETGGYVSYQCVLPMHVHGTGYMQMQMISNSKAEKMMVPCVLVNQLSFDIETFSHHIAEWLCARFSKKYWHCSDYDIEIIDVCALSGDVICLLIMKIQASELGNQTQCSQERKQYEVGCKFTWNIDTNQYRITDVIPMAEVKPKSSKRSAHAYFRSPTWNPTKLMAPQMREQIQQPYARTVRFLHNEMTLAGESITRLHDLDNLVEFYITPPPNYPL